MYLTEKEINSIYKQVREEFERKPKMVIVVRKDLNMRKGKIGAQCAHAAVGAVLQALFASRLDESDFTQTRGVKDKTIFSLNKHTVAVPKSVKDWFAGEFTKICVYVNSEEELNVVAEKARDLALNVCEITDNGHTEFHGEKTKTCLAIGPDESYLIDKVTGSLPLY
jgi:PTH2 family peptidyl-tRNA hydrolase